MTMTAAGVAKAIEEAGELTAVLGNLVQTLGKKLAMWDQDDHWDGTNLKIRLEDEMADVQASLGFVAIRLGLDRDRIAERRIGKIEMFGTWQALLDNNDHGIDAPGIQAALLPSGVVCGPCRREGHRFLYATSDWDESDGCPCCAAKHEARS